MKNGDGASFFIVEAIKAKNSDRFFCDGEVGRVPYYVTSTVQCKCNAHLTVGHYGIYIPVVYLFDQGISMHFCIQMDLDMVREYIQKWFNVSTSEKKLVERTNPLKIKTVPSVMINGIPLNYNHRSETYWIPDAQTYHMNNPPEGEALLQQYNLDSKKVWLFQRIQCPWNKCDMCKVETIQFGFSLQGPSVLGPKISSLKKNRDYNFCYPGHDTKFNMKILSYNTEIANQCSNSVAPYGKFATEICYAISPNQEEPLLEIMCRDNSHTQWVLGAGGIRTTLWSTSPDIRDTNCYATCIFHDKPIQEVELQLLLLGVQLYSKSEVMNFTELPNMGKKLGGKV